MKKLYEEQEEQKKQKYNQRVINVEKGTFCPLVYSTSGGTGLECSNHHKRVAHAIAMKRNEKYSDVISYIRTKIRFALLKSVLVSIRGARGPQKPVKGIPVAAVSFGLIPDEATYEA